MDGRKLLDILRKQFNVESDIDLSKSIGISVGTIKKWKSNSANLTPVQIGNLVAKARKKESDNSKASILSAIKPIIEYYKICHANSRQGANQEIIPSKRGKGKKIKSKLEEVKGIYIYYNSQGEAIYVGKAKAQSLWKEMNLAFNRQRDTQVVWKVQYPEETKDLNLDQLTHEFPRLKKIRKTRVFLADIATYFSAYEVNFNLIDNLEALMIRSFINDLTNVKIEPFKK